MSKFNKQLIKTNNSRAMQAVAYEAGKMAAVSAAPYVMDAAKQLVNYAGNQIKSKASKFGKASKRVNKEMETGIIPHVSGVPASIGSRFTSVKPRFRTVGQSVIISHREPLRNIYSFNGLSSNIVGFVNPFNPYVFPWLATIAGSYDEYKILKMQIEYVPLCATTQTGQVTMAWDPQGSDATADYYDLAMMHSVTFSPWMPAVLNLPSSVKKYMGEQVASTATAADLYNHGKLFWGTFGNDTNAVGTIYITYSVQLFNPQPTTGLASIANPVIAASGVVPNNWGTMDGFNINFDSATGVLLPFGVWKIEIFIMGTVLNAAGVTITSGSALGIAGTRTITNAGQTLNSTWTFARSSGSTLDWFNYQTTYTTQTANQVRITRVDPASYAAAAILV